MPEHIVKAYDDELKNLTDAIARMGGLCERQLADAMDAVTRRDSDLAGRTIESDLRIDELETEIDQRVVRLLALRQPMARDLREILAALRISADLERIGDYATNVAKRAIALSQSPPMRSTAGISRMSVLVLAMIKDILDAYLERDLEKATDVWRRDEEVDELYTSLFRELLTYMMEDPRNISPCTHLLFIAKNIERIGDHATNVAETIHFLVEGRPLTEARPKGDTSSLEVVEPVAAAGAARGRRREKE